jgi:dTDP-4-amino-4,6-dideoxygalactose transaminase
MEKIPFNKPYLTGKEVHYIYQSVNSLHISGNGVFTKKCHEWFRNKFGFKHNLLTTSCTDALEMSALLSDINPGDEVIVPSYTFVSSALAFVRQGAKIVFADSKENHPNIDENKIEELITPKTKALVVVHYAGAACNMDKIMEICQKHNIVLIEDAAQAIDSYYKGTQLGNFGDFAAFSFHETKNIQCGEGGLLVTKNTKKAKRAEILWEKGTNRSAFFRGEVNKYGWVDTGSSFLPSDIVAAFLYAQLENLENIQTKRKYLWNAYHERLQQLEQQGKIKLPLIPEYATNNAHMFYILTQNLEERSALIDFLKKRNISAVFHYLCLHKSEYYKNKHDGRNLPNAQKFEDSLLRLPLYNDMTENEVEKVADAVIEFYT